MALRTPWNDWFHCSGHTYGSWLRGDPRGWRARHHREHVEGDYRNPPATGSFDRLFKHSKKLMKREPVTLSPEARELACRAMVESVQRHGIEIIAACVTAHHIHLLMRCPDRRADWWIGIAKKDSARVLSDAELVARGGTWAKRAKAEPIRNRRHQVNSVKYILDHIDEGSAIWALPPILERYLKARNKKRGTAQE